MNYIWKEACLDEQQKWQVGRWFKDTFEKDSWEKQMKEDSNKFIQEFKKLDDYKLLILDFIEQYQKYIKDVKEVYLQVVRLINKTFADAFLEASDYQIIKLKLLRAESEYSLKYEFKQEKITSEIIQKAKEHPFENLIKVERGWSLCPFHNDRKPSMYVKNNFGYCFSCQKNVDTIQLLIERDGLNFIQAVMKLQ